MTNLQIAKLGKILKLFNQAEPANMDIYVHNVSKEAAKKIIKGMPKCFHRTTRITDSGNNWKEATKGNIYGLGRLQVTVFYPKSKGGDKK